jgi:hypothetical protein
MVLDFLLVLVRKDETSSKKQDKTQQQPATVKRTARCTNNKYRLLSVALGKMEKSLGKSLGKISPRLRISFFLSYLRVFVL